MQSAFETLVECEERGIGVTIAAIFASGLLVGGDTYKYEKAPQEMRDKTEAWKALAAKYNLTLPALAMAFAFLPCSPSFAMMPCASVDFSLTRYDRSPGSCNCRHAHLLQLRHIRQLAQL